MIPVFPASRMQLNVVADAVEGRDIAGVLGDINRLESFRHSFEFDLYF